ncbi:hypothetical protein RND81_14G154900 [Saponaria officinalis]|uniref:Uncharacterized protein n=1 Tax=Saponaria officinalis TaxID=3572 RepID=A0AAW1GM86_SAPOF
MVNPKSLEGRVMKARYFMHDTIVDARRGYDPSFAWRSLCGAKSLLLEGLQWQVGNGELIRIWEDPWLPGERERRVPQPNIEANPSKRIASLIDAETGSWREEDIRALLTEEEEETESEYHAIFTCYLTRNHYVVSDFSELGEGAPRTSFPERLVWSLQQLGEAENGRFLALIWALWTIRNSCIFDEDPINPTVVIMGFTRMEEYQGYASKVGERSLSIRGVGGGTWQPPKPGTIKINSNATLIGEAEVGMRVVGRDTAGRVVMVASKRI